MTSRRRTLLATSTLLVAAVCAAAAVALRLARPDLPGEDSALGQSIGGLAYLLAAMVGWLLATRRPHNPLGWILVAFGAESAVFFLCSQYASAGLGDRWSLPHVQTVAWLAQGQLVGDPVLMSTLLALFPDGRLVSPRWRPFWPLAWAAALTGAFGYALAPGRLSSVESVNNPYAAGGATGHVAEICRAVAGVALIVLFIVAAASLVVRWRRRRGVERQQIKWLLLAASTIIAVFVLALIDAASAFRLSDQLAFVLFTLALAGMPVAIGVAVMKYRLYDIDRIVSRALVYAVVTAALAAVYLVAVLVLQAVLAPVTSGSSVAVAASTLAAAAAFRPLRHRVQRTVDRRFNRQRYNAARTVEAFATRLRDQVDLDTLTADLVGVVRATVAPASVSVWLRGASAQRAT
ncbi:MAG: hypothetical protein ABR520_10700 [Mycobacteriales bacterium]|nr:hypothetical protein [Frankia sp.]